MLRHVIHALAFTAMLASTVAHAEREVACPNVITYSNGNYLKAGDNFYYSNGNYLKAGGNLYFPNGNYLKAGENLYYSTGNYLKAGANLYYPGGNYLKAGASLYYPGGGYLKAGTNFYYENGNYARAGSTLYRQDGSTTAFPVVLSSLVGTEGSFRVEVGSNYEEMALAFDRLISSNDVASSALAVDAALNISNVRLVVNSGQPNENVVLNVAIDGSYTCGLSGSSQPSVFTLNAAAATVDVRVKDGYDPRTVRNALQQALNGL